MERVLRYQRKIIDKKCIECGKEFSAKRRLKSVCSAECKRVRKLRVRPKARKICSHCKNEFAADNRKRKFCGWECKKNAMRTGRRKKTITIPKARKAQRDVAYAIQTGKLVRPTVCEECQCADRKIEAAHFNYEETLRVRWLCSSCHRKWDKAEPKGATYSVAVRQNIRQNLQTGEQT